MKLPSPSSGISKWTKDLDQPDPDPGLAPIQTRSRSDLDPGTTMEPLSLLLCWALLGVACAGEDAPVHYEEPKERDPFTYDYQSLRIGGLIFAVILFLLGILIIFSRRCRCKFNQQQRTGEPDEEEGTLRSSIRRYRDSGDPFKYDYDTLRLVGLVLAIVMFVLGILTALRSSSVNNLSRACQQTPSGQQPVFRCWMPPPPGHDGAWLQTPRLTACWEPPTPSGA
ncbi:uncharacterized protein LOC102568737 isoform X3 [Alligator mississippiensis]|uniref:uncharacterized protein LOC102568737 isoform X3 n=1 Tax=Alligator mississippiensis TaxID=8496 RepID=UPI00287742BC|nr:uncharacterized protein LOC102568737 isoform X3 [Alligator mississippiensis]